MDRWERREKKQESKRSKMKKSGKGFIDSIKKAIEKRSKKDSS